MSGENLQMKTCRCRVPLKSRADPPLEAPYPAGGTDFCTAQLDLSLKPLNYFWRKTPDAFITFLQSNLKGLTIFSYLPVPDF
jgi:hypothetical protein